MKEIMIPEFHGINMQVCGDLNAEEIAFAAACCYAGYSAEPSQSARNCIFQVLNQRTDIGRRLIAGLYVFVWTHFFSSRSCSVLIKSLINFRFLLVTIVSPGDHCQQCLVVTSVSKPAGVSVKFYQAGVLHTSH